LVQGTGVPYCPFGPQVSTPPFEHCFAPGVHTPVHAPFTHAWPVHGEAVPHCPVASQIWTPPFEHCFAPGAHTPVHAPFTQA
jgi:hypothetical protein